MVGGEDLPTLPSAPLPKGDFMRSIEIGDYPCLDAIKTFSKPAITSGRLLANDPTKIAVARIIAAGISSFFNQAPGLILVAGVDFSLLLPHSMIELKL
jgi:hypothetical protein